MELLSKLTKKTDIYFIRKTTTCLLACVSIFSLQNFYLNASELAENSQIKTVSREKTSEETMNEPSKRFKLQEEEAYSTLKKISSEFDSAPAEERYSIVSRPLTVTDADGKQKTHAYNKTSLMHGLSLAVIAGDKESLQKFLTAVPDINVEELDIWGYRQRYTMAHLAMHPFYPIGFDKITIDNRIEIIHTLGQKGMDFSIVRTGNSYRNQALAVGVASGMVLKEYKCLQPYALLYEANPLFVGTSVGFSHFDREEETLCQVNDYTTSLYNDALDLWYRLSPDDKQHVKLHFHTKKRFQEIIKSRQEMDSLLFG